MFLRKVTVYETSQPCEQDRQCTYNVTLRSVRPAIVAVEEP